MIELKNRIAEGQFYFLLTFILVSDMVNYISNEPVYRKRVIYE